MGPMSLERFKKEVQPARRKSKLEPYKEAIVSLANEGYTGKQIYLYLTQYEGLEITLDAVYKFLRKIKSKNIVRKDFEKKRTFGPKNSTSHTNTKLDQLIQQYQECAKETDLAFTMPNGNIESKEVVANGVKIDITDERLSDEQRLFLALKEANVRLIGRCPKLRSVLKIWENTLFPVRFIDGRSELVFDFFI